MFRTERHLAHPRKTGTHADQPHEPARLIAAVYGVVSSLSPSLQILRMRRAGSSESLSRSYLMIGAGGYMIWFMYGLSLGNMPLTVADAIGAVMQLTVLWWAYRLDERRASTA
jgi:uncharacterized protein with PQ loop repeat